MGRGWAEFEKIKSDYITVMSICMNLLFVMVGEKSFFEIFRTFANLRLQLSQFKVKDT